MFRDRAEAGRLLGASLRGRVEPEVLVLGIPRGGVVIAREVARALGAPLDVVVPRKIGAPGNQELAIGAIAPGVEVWDEDLLRRLDVPEPYRRAQVLAQEGEIARRTSRYRGARPPLDLRGRTVLLVDDGLATGATALAAVRWARAEGASRIEIAVPVAARETVGRLAAEADAVHTLSTPDAFRAVGEWYRDFEQTTDAEVVKALETDGTP